MKSSLSKFFYSQDQHFWQPLWFPARNPIVICLFDGDSLANCEIESGGQFAVEGGVLKANKGTGWVSSKSSYSDFRLVMEFPFLEEAANSGVFVRTGPTSIDDENGWPENGYKIQRQDTLESDYPMGSLIPYGAPAFESKTDMELCEPPISRPANGEHST